ncbi:MAG: DUF2339 domain-containing protein [Verrucomicrobiota bacterium]
MNPYEGAPEREELDRLRENLDGLSIRYNAEMDSIRIRIFELEARFSEAPQAAPELATDFQEPEPAIVLPPPLPKASAFKQAKLIYASAPAAAEIPAPAEFEAPPVAPPEPDESFELQLGKVWAGRIGIVIFLTGLVFLGNHAYKNWIKDMPNGVRLAALFLCAGALAEAGRRLAKKENLNRFGEVLLAGGMAFFYYCTFAAHHVTRLKVIESPVLAASLLFLSAGAIAAVSWIRQAKITAAFGLVLAAYATMLQPIGWMSCVSNLLLAAIGLFFMLKPGWAGPGWASMLGSYAAFLGSQILARFEYGYTSDPLAILWFLPPLWIMFAIPGMLGRFRESLSDRARAWFTGVNNGLFFLMFSALWIDQYHQTDYWKVAAVFGSVLLGLGIIGRRQDTIAGGVNISQGLTVGTLALVLKLDGHQLALVLAVESVSLALAAWKFRSRSEAVFSLLSGLGAAGVLIINNGSVFQSIPIWSISLTALMIAAASIVLVRVKPIVWDFYEFVRFSSGLLLITAALIATQLCLFRLEPSTGLITAGLLAGLLSAAHLKLDSKHLQPESIWISLWFLGVSVWMGFHSETMWPLGVMVALTLAGCWLWHRQPEVETEDSSFNLTHHPALPAWLFSAAVTFFVWQVSIDLSPSFRENFLFNQIAAIALLAVAIFIRCSRLTITSAVLGFLSLSLLLEPDARVTSHIFATVFISFAAAGLLNTSWVRANASVLLRYVSAIIFRFTGFVAYMVAWYQVSPEAWGDWIALTSVIGIIVFAALKRTCFMECVGWIIMSMIWLFVETMNAPWAASLEHQSWRGVVVILALLVLTTAYKLRPTLIDDIGKKDSLGFCVGLTCIVITLWATQMLVWRFDWKPAAVLWTILGFMFVSAGLWQRLHVARVIGFLLLALSLGKLFVSDVWDFTAFMRVVSFIVLGAALILLGLFYNKFAPAIKALLDSEK